MLDNRKAERRKPARTPDGQLIIEVAFTEHDAQLLLDHLRSQPETFASQRLATAVECSLLLTQHHAVS